MYTWLKRRQQVLEEQNFGRLGSVQLYGMRMCVCGVCVCMCMWCVCVCVCMWCVCVCVYVVCVGECVRV